MLKTAKSVWGWTLYDWANASFSTTVLAGFFPVFFKMFWAAGLPATQSTFVLGAANSAASLVVAVLAPVLGAIADRGSSKKRFLALFGFLGVVMTVGLWFVGQGDWATAVLLFLGGSVGYFGALVFYDSLLVSVAPREKWDSVSSLGYALGYLGGGLLFAFNVLLTQIPQTFGLPDGAAAVKVSFVLVALWWVLFSLPLFFWVDEPKSGGGRPPGSAVREGFAQLAQTLRHLSGEKQVVLFLFAYWFYIDGVGTVVKMAVDYGTDLGLPSSSLIVALLMVQFIAFPSALGYLWVSKRIGVKPAILVGVAGYLAIITFGYFLKDMTGFFILAGCVGLFQGGIQALSRSAFARLVPPAKSGEYFGFFNMFGKFAAILGPFLMGVVAQVSGSSRVGILSLMVLFVTGGVLFTLVKVPRA